MKKENKLKLIVEKQLGIGGDYQYKALRSRNFWQSNWHYNKWVVIEKLLKLYRPKTVLDLGTGSGNFELFFARQVEKIVGVDYNDEALFFLESQLKKKGINNVRLINQNIENIATDLGKFDMILMIDVLEHLNSNAARDLIAGFKKMLNPKGKIVIVTPNYEGFWPFIEGMIDRFTTIPHLEDLQHLTKFNPGRLRQAFQKQGYRLDNFSTFNTFSFLIPGKKLSALACQLELKLSLPFGNLMVCVFGI